jgi:hypothetical protein
MNDTGAACIALSMFLTAAEGSLVIDSFHFKWYMKNKQIIHSYILWHAARFKLSFLSKLYIQTAIGLKV